MGVLILSVTSSFFIIGNTDLYHIIPIIELVFGILISLCILLQKNWPLSIKGQSIFAVIIVFVYLWILYPLISICVFILYEYLFLRNHKYYDNLDNIHREQEPIKFIKTILRINKNSLTAKLLYKKGYSVFENNDYVYINLNAYLLWSVYISTLIIILASPIILIGASISPGNSNIASSILSEKSMVGVLLTAFVSPPNIVLIFTQKNWNLYTKIINILIVCIIFMVSSYLIFFPVIIPIIGALFIRYMFIKSSLKSSINNVEQEKGA